MLKDFDIAFTNKVKAWFSNTIYANTAVVYNVAYNLVDDATVQLRFPLISIYRPTGFEMAATQTFGSNKKGIEYFYDDQTNESVHARFLTVILPYQLDIYTKSPEDLDDITENIMQAFNFDSTLTVSQINENNDQAYEERYDITYNNGPVEQSEFNNNDRVYHYSLVYAIKNARLVNFKTVPSIDEIEIDIDAEGEDI
jgi:hypothetical protein